MVGLDFVKKKTILTAELVGDCRRNGLFFQEYENL